MKMLINRRKMVFMFIFVFSLIAVLLSGGNKTYAFDPLYDEIVDQKRIEEEIDYLQKEIELRNQALEEAKKAVDSKIEFYKDLLETQRKLLNNPDDMKALGNNKAEVEKNIEGYTKDIEILTSYRDQGLSISREPGQSIAKSLSDFYGVEERNVDDTLHNVYYQRFCIERLNILIALCIEKKDIGITREEYERLSGERHERAQNYRINLPNAGKGLVEIPYSYSGSNDLDNEVYSLLLNYYESLSGSGKGTSAGSNTSGKASANPLSDSLYPAVGVSLALLIMLGISGTLGGRNESSDSMPASDMGADDDGSLTDEQAENGSMILDVQIKDKALAAGDSNTAVVLFAAIRTSAVDDNNPGQDEIKAAMYSIRVLPQGPAAQYVYMEAEDAAEWDDWRRYYIYFTYKANNGNNADSDSLVFPLKVPIVVTADSNVSPSQKTVYLNIEKPESSLAIDPKTIVLADDAKASPHIAARVFTMDEGKWEYEYSIVDSLENAVRAVSFMPETDKTCSITVVPLRIPEGAGSSIVNEVLIKALNKSTCEAIEAKLTVTVAREGLVAVSEKPLSITAGDESATELKITALSAMNGELHTDYDLLQRVKFDDGINAQSQLAANAFETAGLEITDGGWAGKSIDDNKALACYIYKLKTKREIPGQGENHYGQLTLTASKEGKEYHLRVPVVLDVATLGPGSKAWEVELDRCKRIIGKIPKEHQERFLSFLDKKAQLLGARGLYELRYKIWKIGQTLWEAEGLSGYDDVERWNGYIENTLNFANWLGKLATDVLLSQHVGVFKAIAAGELYNVIVSAINAYSDGLGFDEWFSNYFIKQHFAEVLQSLGAEGVEQGIEKWLAKNPRGAALAVMAYFSYFFITNMLLKKMGAIEAVKAAAQSVAYAAAVKFLSVKVKAYMKKGAKTDIDTPESKPKTDNSPDFIDNQDYEKGFSTAREKINSLTDAINNGNRDEITRKIMDIKTDKYSIAEINKVMDGKPVYPDGVKNIINDVFENEIKSPTKKMMDDKVLDYYKSKGYNDVELVFESKSNKSDIVKVGSDWDVSYKVKYLDKKGRIKVEDMKAMDLKPILEDSLYQAAGKKYAGKLGKHDFAEELMDVSAMGPDAAGGYGKDVNAALNMKDTSDALAQMDKKSVKSAVDELKANTGANGQVKLEQLSDNAKQIKGMLDKVKLEDPSSLGIGTGYKELEWFNRSGADNVEIQGKMLEGMKQLSKQYNNILTPMKNIVDTVSGQKTTKLPSVLSDAVDLFNKGKSPEYIDNLLKAKGSSLRDVAGIMKSQIEAYGSMLK